MTPDDPRHGTTAGHNAGCRLECCRAAKLRYDKRRRWEARQGHARLVDNTGTRRRIQALAAIGHSVPDIATHAGVSHRTLNGLDRTTRVTPAIARAIAETYETLCMTPATHPYALRNRRIAARKGWPPPLAWDDIDNPHEQPKGVVYADDNTDCDDMVVERILAGDWRLKANLDQRLAVIERWTAGGQSQNSLERLTGWNVTRDLRTARAKDAA